MIQFAGAGNRALVAARALRSLSFAFLVLVSAGLATRGLIAEVYAGTISVTDEGSPTESTCTLAQAINAANNANLSPTGEADIGACVGASVNTVYDPENTLTLVSGTEYIFTNAGNWWYGPNALPPITSRIAIEGNGATLIAQHIGDPAPNAAHAFRFFYVSGGLAGELPLGALRLHSVTLRGGVAKGGDSGHGGGGAGMGGAIFNQGILTLQAVTLNGNTAQGGRAYISSSWGGGGMGEDAPASYNGGGFGGFIGYGHGGYGSPNPAGGGGGFVGGSNGGSGYAGNGGGFGGLGGVGGGVAGGVGGAAGDGGGGGGYDSASGGLDAGGNFGFGGTGDEFAPGGGGGVGGGGGSSQFDCGGGGGFGGGAGAGCSGRYWNPARPTGGFGGGSGQATNDYLQVSFGGGGGYPLGILYLAGGGAGMGGAIFNHRGIVHVTNVTAVGNNASGGALLNNAGQSDGSGLGAVLFNLNGSVQIDFSTLAQNLVSGSNMGGIAVGPGDAAIYSLAYGNKIEDASASAATLSINNSIIYGTDGAANEVVNNSVDGTQSNTATLTYMGSNIVGSYLNVATLEGNSTTPQTRNPKLGQLGANGVTGVPQTMSVVPGSPAYNAASSCNDASNPAIATTADERGKARPDQPNSTCDIGAYEAQSDDDGIFADGFEY